MIDRITEQPFCQTDVIASTVILGDCMPIMKKYDDGHFNFKKI